MGKEMAPVTVVAFRAESLLTEWQKLGHPIADQIFPERKYSVPLECLRDLLVDLQRLQASKLEHPAENLDQDVGAHQDRDINDNEHGE